MDGKKINSDDYAQTTARWLLSFKAYKGEESS